MAPMTRPPTADARAREIVEKWRGADPDVWISNDDRRLVKLIAGALASPPGEPSAIPADACNCPASIEGHGHADTCPKRVAAIAARVARLEGALRVAKDEIEGGAARRAYHTGLGASEWESCLYRYEIAALKAIDAALAPEPGSRGAGISPDEHEEIHHAEAHPSPVLGCPACPR